MSSLPRTPSALVAPALVADMKEPIPPARATDDPRKLLMRRVYVYLRDHPDPQPRDLIMHYTGFPSPLAEPVSAYVMFQNAVIRVNAALASRGVSQRIIGGCKHGERYWLEPAT